MGSNDFIQSFTYKYADTKGLVEFFSILPFTKGSLLIFVYQELKFTSVTCSRL